MTEKSGTPVVRFKGFTDTWEQRELGNISEKVSKKNQDMVCDEVFTNSAEYGIISQRDFFDKDIANGENIDGYYIVEPNDFVHTIFLRLYGCKILICLCFMILISNLSFLYLFLL